MTGMEAWTLIAPLLSQYINNIKGQYNPLMDAWVTVFGALNEYDKRRKSDGSDKQTGGDRTR